MCSAYIIKGYVHARPGPVTDPDDIIARMTEAGRLLEEMETPRLLVDTRHMQGVLSPVDGARVVSALAEIITKDVRIAFLFSDKAKHALSRPVLFGMSVAGYDIGGFHDEDGAVEWMLAKA